LYASVLIGWGWMKIVHVVYSLEMGGAEMLVAQLCRMQRAKGHEVSVCAYARLGAVGEVLRAEGFAIHVPGEAHPAKTMWRYFQLFRRMKPEVVHCHNPAPTLQAAMSARLAGARCVVSTRHSLVAPPYDTAEELKYNVMACFCDWIVGICEITCKNLRETPLAHRDKVVRVYNGAVAVERTGFAELGKRGFTLLFVGRLAAVKDLGTLLRAVALAVARVPTLEFWIVGDGPARGELEALAHQLGIVAHVRFWGQRLDTAEFFSAADVFAMSSVSEGLPMSLLQAMSLGVPALVTDVGGMAEVVRLAGGGMLAPVGDAAALAEAIVRLAEDAALREGFGQRGFEAYEAEFTLERMEAAYAGIYARAR
jgi:glycosyltransferase involved in cell wall biosynthesis